MTIDPSLIQFVLWKSGQTFYFNPYNNTPTKASAYLLPVRTNNEDKYFELSSGVTSIDATNFSSITQKDNKLVYSDDGSFTGKGYMYVFSDGATSFLDDDFSEVYYPIKASVIGLYTLWVRVKTTNATFSMDVLLDDDYFASIYSPSLTTDWQWFSVSLNIIDTNTHNLGIKLQYQNDGVDKIAITSSVIAPAGDGPDLSDSKYITVHSNVYSLDNNGKPDIKLNIYDYETTVNDILLEGWYNFDLNFINGQGNFNVDNSYAFVLTTSGSNDNKYIVWDINLNSGYVYGPALFKYELSPWYLSYEYSHSLIIYSDFDSVNEYGKYIKIQGPESAFINVNKFNTSQLKLYNTKIVDDDLGGEDIELKLEDKMIGIILDESGSMRWNDTNNLRHTLAKRFIHRAASTYPGDLSFSIFTFGGRSITPVFSSSVRERNMFSQAVKNENPFETDAFADEVNNFAGVRVLRNPDHFPITPIDGNILFDGLSSKYIDAGLDENKMYYYSLYTFDQKYNFSEPSHIKITPKSEDIPQGLKTFSYNVYNGTGSIVDNDTFTSWHFNEGSEDIVYDFNAKLDLTINDNDPKWLTKNDVPLGLSGLRFPLDNINASVLDLDNILELSQSKNKKMTFSCWIKPYDYLASTTIFSRGDSVLLTSNYSLVLGINNELIFNTDFDSITTPNNIITREQWSYIVTTIDLSSGNVQFYINGLLVYEEVLSNTNINISNNMSFCLGYDNGINGFKGLFGEITEVNVYNTIKDLSYIHHEYNKSRPSDQDNGDRLIVFNYHVPVDHDSIGGKIRVVKNDIKIPSNEEDGEIIYEETSSVGDFRFSYREDFVIDSIYYFRIFVTDINSIYNNINDSMVLSVDIPDLSEESRQFLSTVDPYYPYDNYAFSILPPSVLVSNAGNSKSHLAWSPISDINIKRTKIYCSTSSCPIVDDNDYTGDLVFTGDASITDFVHRNLINDNTYYYTLVNSDRYNRTSESLNKIVIPQSGLDESNIPLAKVLNISYEINNANSISVLWDNPVKNKKVNAYFDQDVNIYAKFIDDNNNIIADEYNVNLDMQVSYTYDTNVAEDVFEDESTLNTPLPQSLYKSIVVYKDGIYKATIRINENLELSKNIKYINLSTKFKFSIPNTTGEKDANGNYTENVFEFVTSPINVEFKNPLSFDVQNRDQKYITRDVINTVSNLQNNDAPEVIKYNGIYTGASQPFIVRLSFLYKDLPITGSNIDVKIYDSPNELPADQSKAVKTNESEEINTNFDKSNIIIQTTSVDILDSFGNPTGNKETISYFDISITSSVSKNTILYIKYSYLGYSFVKKIFVVFDSPLKIEIHSRIPLSDGIDVAEQAATIYQVDPDDPENISRISYPTGDLIVKWELIPGENGIIRSFFSKDNVNLLNGVYSRVVGGVAKNVFIGPISDARIYGYENGIAILEQQELRASVVQNGNISSDSKIIEITPLFQKSSDNSYFLMEFDNIKQDLWSDGDSYVRLRISHNANTSTTNMSGVFRSCMATMGKIIYELQRGMSVNILTDNNDTEIIWGDVTEFLNPYTGRWELDTKNADIAYGNAYVQLSDDDFTFVYFRINKFYPDQNTVGFKYIENPLCNCIGIDKKVDYKYEIKVWGFVTTVISSKSVNLQGGGDLNTGLPPTILIPKEPLNIRVIDKRINGSSVKSLVIDGETINEIVLDVSFSGYTVPDGTILNLQVLNSLGDFITLMDNSITTTSYIDLLIDPLNIRSYASLKIQPIPTGKTFDSHIYIKSNYDLTKHVSREKVLCLTINIDSDVSVASTIDASIFSNRVDAYKISTGLWQNRKDLNHERGYLIAENVGGKIYAIGGIDGKNIVNYVEEYDFSSDTWTDKNSMPTARMSAMSVSVGTDIYVFGGIVYDILTNKISMSRASEKYDTLTDTWAILEEMPMIDNDNFKDIPYGIAFGAAKYIAGKIYILSGIKDISEDGLFVDYNNRILYYDIVSDTWGYSDIISKDEFNIYYKISPIADVQGNEIFVFGGAYQETGKDINYVSDVYSYNVTTAALVERSEEFDDIPQLRYKASCCSDGVSSLYVLGGANGKSQYLKSFEKFDFLAAANAPDYTKSILADMDKSRNGSASVYLTSGLDSYVFSVGGLESGRENNFLHVGITPYEIDLLLNYKQHLAVDVELTNDNGDRPVGDINVELSGYVQFYDENNLPVTTLSDLISYRIVFESSSVIISNGKGYALLMPRSDDLVNNVINKIYLEEDVHILRYVIMVKAAISDANYYGQNFVEISSSVLSGNSSIVSYCVPLSTNVSIESLTRGQSSNKFRLISLPLEQAESAIVNAESDKLSLPYTSDLTNGETVSASNAITIIDDLDDVKPDGISPLYDMISETCANFSLAKFENKNKIIYVFSDGEENSSFNSLQDIITSAKTIGQYKSVPFIISNLSVGCPTDLAEMEYKTPIISVNQISIATGGQSLSVVSENIDDVNKTVEILTGETKGSLGYGTVEYILDLGETVNINSIAVYFKLYNNTNGSWLVSNSIDSYNYFPSTGWITPNTEVELEDIYARYLKFNMKLISGLSVSNEEAYEDIPLPGSPIILSIKVNYNFIREDYIYSNIIETSNALSQIVLSSNYNSKFLDNNDSSKSILLGASISHSHEWNDFYSDAQPSTETAGRIVYLNRSGELNGVQIDQLESVDGYLYKSKYKRWPPGCSVEVYDKDNNLISSFDYREYPRNGYIVFSSRKEGNYSIKIIPSNIFRTGTKITTGNVNKLVKIYGLGYMFDTRQ